MKNFIGLCMKLKKLLTNKQYQKYLIKMNIEEKRNLGLKSTVRGVEIEPFK